MAIDTSIYNNLGRGVTNPLEVLQSMQAADRGRQMNQLGALQLQDAQDQRDQRDRLRSILARMNPQGKAADQAAELQRGGFLKEGRDLLQADALAQKTQREGDRAAIETAGKRAELAGQLMSGAKDQASYDAVRQQLTGVMGADAVAQMPAQFDPQFAQRVIQQSMGTVEQAKQNLQALQQQETGRHNLATEGETGRHNLQAEAVARGQLGVAQGQLGVARANSAESARHNKANEGLKEQEVGALAGMLNGGKIPGDYMLDPANPGRVTPIPGSRADPSNPANWTEGERTGAARYELIRQGNAAMDAALATNPKSARASLIESIPGLPDAVKNMMLSGDRQKFSHGAALMEEGVTRILTGAGMSLPEAQRRARDSTPQYGDDPALVQQKLQMRKVFENMGKSTAGRAAGSVEQHPSVVGIPGLAGMGAVQGVPGVAPAGGAPAQGADDPLGMRGGR